MKDLKITKGEWKINWYKGDFNIPVSISIQKEINYGTYHEVICDILHGALDDSDYLKNWKEKTEANAKLIEQAPNMFDLLSEMTEYIQGMDSNNNVVLRIPLKLSKKIGETIQSIKKAQQ